jgi:hypothetical protein
MLIKNFASGKLKVGLDRGTAWLDTGNLNL